MALQTNHLAAARRHRRHRRRRPPPPYALLPLAAMGNFLTSPLTTKETETGANDALAFGVSAMQGWRTSMEDTHITALAPEGFPPGVAIFAVFDGHGGRLASQVSSELLPHVLVDVFETRKYYTEGGHTPTPEEIGDALRETFLAIDAEIRSYPEVTNNSDQSGCTAIAAVVTPTHIIVANAGASRDASRAIFLTIGSLLLRYPPLLLILAMATIRTLQATRAACWRRPRRPCPCRSTTSP